MCITEFGCILLWQQLWPCDIRSVAECKYDALDQP